MVKKLMILAFLGALGVACALGYSFYEINSWSNAPTSQTHEGEILTFPSGTSLKTLAASLEKQGLIDSALKFEALVRMQRNYGTFQAGRYKFDQSPTPADIVSKITKGEVYWPVVMEFTIPEGFTLKKVADRLAAKGIGHINELKTLLFDKDLTKQLKIPSKTFEGYLYPATYRFIKVPSPLEAITHMVETFKNKMPKNYEKRLKKMGLSLHQGVTFASLIELETLHDDEKPVISEVIWRRLKDKVPLGIDAALIYGIKDYRGDIKWVHLKDAKNPYNSRIHKGLPPTPIGAPGKASMEAVLTPTNTGAYYYVLRTDSNRHHFSKTLKEHNIYVRKLIQASKRKKSK